MKKEVKAVRDETKIAYCGLYCGACGRFLSGRCPGCTDNVKASWCRTRSCCIAKKYRSCADCTEYADIMECRDYNTFVSKIFGFIFRSNRKACVDMIREKGYAGYAREMAGKGIMRIRK